MTIRERPNEGRPKPWEVGWRERQPGQKKSKKRARYFLTEAEAKKFVASVEHEEAIDSTPEPETPKAPAGTVSAYLTDWLANHVKRHNDAATYRSYESLTRLYIIPHLGDIVFTELRRKRIKQFMNDLYDGGVKLGNRKHIHSCLSSACGQAVIEEDLEYNPCEKLGKMIRQRDEDALEPEPNPFTATEAAAFLKYVEEHERDWLEYFQFLHDVGCRVGELAALKWKNVDLSGKRARIEASFSPSEGEDKAPKTHQRRWVDLTDLVVDQLTEWRVRQKKDGLRRGRPVKPSTYMLTNTRGSARRQDGNMRRVFARVLVGMEGKNWTKEQRAEWRTHTPHDIRDTFATTHLLADYTRLPWVSAQLGHETERTTQEHYFKFLPSTYTRGFANKIRQAADPKADSR